MYVIDAIEFYGTRHAISEALKGHRHRSAPYQWPLEGLVPLQAALLLQRHSKGRLKVNPDLYESYKDYRENTKASQRDLRRLKRVLARAPRVT